MIPALVAISGVTVAWLSDWSQPRGLEAKSIASIVAIVVVFASGWATARWVPYSYAFINPIAGWNHPQRDWELDYWGVTAFEGVDRLKQAGLDAVGVLPTEETATLFGGTSVENALAISGGDQYGLYVFKRWDVGIGECESLFTIRRDGQILGEGARCRPGP